MKMGGCGGQKDEEFNKNGEHQSKAEGDASLSCVSFWLRANSKIGWSSVLHPTEDRGRNNDCRLRTLRHAVGRPVVVRNLTGIDT